MMRSLRGIWLALLLCGAAACAQVPQEAVTLSATVGKDIEAVERAHVALANALFDQLESRVNTFIDREYRPTFIQRFVRQFDLAGEITRANQQAPDFVPVLLTDFVSEIQEKIEAKRAELLTPIRQQRQQVLADIRESYDRIKMANAAVTAHLNSVAAVHKAQNEVLTSMGLPDDLRARIGQKVAGLSNAVQSLTEKGQTINTSLAKGQAAVEDTIKKLDSAVDDVATQLRDLGN